MKRVTFHFDSYRLNELSSSVIVDKIEESLGQRLVGEHYISGADPTLKAYKTNTQDIVCRGRKIIASVGGSSGISYQGKEILIQPIQNAGIMDFGLEFRISAEQTMQAKGCITQRNVELTIDGEKVAAFTMHREGFLNWLIRCWKSKSLSKLDNWSGFVFDDHKVDEALILATYIHESSSRELG